MSKKDKKYGIVYSTHPDSFPKEEYVEQITPEPGLQKLTIQLDKKQRAGKIVTLVYGFKGKTEDLDKLGRELKSYCGTGGSVKDGEIIVQGDNRDKILSWCLKMGYKFTRKL
ncbi:MAG: translation initiation factor [Ferruginibacter sp.]